jgi:hypothetical protein
VRILRRVYVICRAMEQQRDREESVREWLTAIVVGASFHALHAQPDNGRHRPDTAHTIHHADAHRLLAALQGCETEKPQKNRDRLRHSKTKTIERLPLPQTEIDEE